MGALWQKNTEFMCMNPQMILYLVFNQIDLCHGYVFGSLTRDTKDILWMDDCVLIITYESLATKSLKYHKLDMTQSLQKQLCG